MKDKKDVWTGTFTCKVCKVQYTKGTYTTRDGVVCNFGYAGLSCRHHLRKQERKKVVRKKK